MLDFEDVTPRKKITENAEETADAVTEEVKEPEMEEVISETAETDPSVESENYKQEDMPEKEPVPQPGVREYHYEEQVKKPSKKKNGSAKFGVG